MSDNGDSQGESLEEGTRQANSNLKRLIDAIGGLQTVSRALLTRVQRILSGSRPAAGGGNESDDRSAPLAKDRGDC